MKNKKGFISMTMLYTYLILFLFIMLSILNAYSQLSKYKDAITDKMKSDLQLSSFRNRSILDIIKEDNNGGIPSDIKSIYVTGNSIDFSSIAYPSNGKGLYYISGKNITEENKTIYFYRGDVKNNYIIYGNSCYRIMRTTEDGNIRMIYYGKKKNNSCQEATYDEGIVKSSINVETTFKSKFNENNSTNDMVNYNNSSLKAKLDSFGTLVNSNDISSNYYCNNKVTSSSSVDSIVYKSYTDSIVEGYIPSLVCKNDSDKYTDLIGTITYEDAIYGGLIYNSSTSSIATNKSYLMNGLTYWTMTPANYSSSTGAKVFAINSFGDIVASPVNEELYVIPVITLKSSIKISRGTGYSTDPYIIKG